MKQSLISALIFLCSVSFATAGWIVEENETLPAPAGISFTRRAVRDEANRKVELHLVGFTTTEHSCVVMDNPAGELTLASAAKKRGVLAAVNGGYFHPDRTPLGLVVRDGKTLHAFERARLLSGLLVVSKGRVTLLRASEFKQSASVREALQAGPFLVDKGRAVAGLNATRFAARTVVLQLEGARRGLLVADSITLAQMGDLLAAKGIAIEGQIVRALNLDGGSSTGLWVRSDPEFYRREYKDVRNYLGIVPLR
ncbi:MAG TPA: phosphodiester glycosidase family protein [Chthoniobacteraceae bacterium]|nr:phosphodiester glycosidase family protein [Chthoniobacteraceae bacterium]